jgi:sugar lactone lactonase YvrE
MRFAFVSCRAAAFVVASLLAGCGGGSGGSSGVPSAVAQPAAHASGAVRFTIAVPKATGTASSARRTPRYVSPATTSMTVNIVTNPGGASVVSQTVSLTTTSNGCSSTLASTLCTLSFSLIPGSYDASISTADAGSTVLSQGQLVDFTIAQGQTNTVSLTLSGIPTALIIGSSTLAVHGTQSTGFTLYGTALQPLVVEALDADGNVIVGPGSPTFTVASVSGSGFTITNPTTTSPNQVNLTPPGTNGTPEVFSLTAAYGDGTCSLAGAVCSATFSVKNHVQTLFVANRSNDNVMEYAPPYTGAPTTISNGVVVPNALAMDTAGDLFVSSRGGGVTEYASPYTGTPTTTIASGINTPDALIFDAAGDLFVANSAGYTLNAGAVTEYAPPYTGTPTTITTGVEQPGGLALDASGNLFVANGIANTVTEYAPPYTGTPTTMSGAHDPSALALNAAGNLFAANGFVSAVTEFTPPYTGAGTTIASGVSLPTAVALDGTGNLFVVNEGTSTVTEYAPPYTGSPTVTITDFGGPFAEAFDDAGNLFVLNIGNNTVTEYAPPYTGTPTATVSSGLTSPIALLLSP